MTKSKKPIEPFYVILTDNGFLIETLDVSRYYGNSVVRMSLSTDDCFEQYHTWYKNNYKDKKENWKPCVKYRYNTYGLYRRKTKASAERMIEKMNSGEIKKASERFPNPRILYIETSFFDFLKYYLGGKQVTVDYGEWNW